MSVDWEARRKRLATWKSDQHRPITLDLLAEKAAWVAERTAPGTAVGFARMKSITGSTAKDKALWTAVAEYIERSMR